MFDTLTDFHFLRPWFLLAIIPACVLIWLLQRQSRSATSWRDVIAPELLKHLLTGQLSKRQRLPFWTLWLAWIVAAVALAGPAWEKLPQPVHKTESALVILLDLSPSMLAQDLTPSRLVRAKHKLTDLLNQRREGVTALVAYAGEAHVVTPLTDDTRTITSLLPALHPSVMPLSGSNTEMAVDLALQLFADAGMSRGQLLLVTDGVEIPARATVEKRLRDGPFSLSVMSVGTDDGAPIPLGSGGFAKDRQGGIVIAKVGSARLRDMAQTLNGIYTPLLPTDADIQHLSAQPMPFDDNTRKLQREFDTWNDLGAYLVLLLLPVVALAFRRGWLVSAAVVILPLAQPQPVAAGVWEDLWQRRDQQGEQSFLRGETETAAQQFRDPQWRGSAHYRSGNYEAAAEAFANGERAVDDYNRGNALAQAGQLDEALQAYRNALEKDPQLEAAKRNAEIVEALKNQQQQNQDQQQQDGDQQQQDGDRQQDGDQGQAGQQDGQPREQDGRQEPSGGQDQSGEQNDRQNHREGDDTGQQTAAQESGDESPEPTPQQAAADDAPPPDAGRDSSAAAAAEAQDSGEEQQALEQWLRQIPDDPSGLLRQKFQHQHRQRRKEYRAGIWQPPENEANKRW